MNKVIAFILTMPHNNSWSGRWSGENDVYARVFSARYAKKNKINPGNYYYNFGDGWTAKVEVVEVDANEARKLRKKSRGFCGYDWMIDSIVMFGEIRTFTMSEAKSAIMSNL